MNRLTAIRLTIREFLRHPIVMTWHRWRHRIITLTDDTWTQVLFVYGNHETPAYSGVQFDGVWIDGTPKNLRRLASLLMDRADRAEAVQQILDVGLWPTHEESAGFPDAFGPDGAWALWGADPLNGGVR